MLVAAASCSSDSGDRSASDAEVEALREQLAAAESRADEAESERDELADALAAVEEQLTAITEGTTPPTAAADTSLVETTSPPTAAPTTTVAPSSGPAAPDASPYVEAIGDVSTLDIPVGEPGVVSVVIAATSLDRSRSLPVVVRNNTSLPVGSIDVTGVARDAAGGLAGSGSSQGFQPVVVSPGEIAFGYVFFGDAVPEGATFELSVSAEAVGDFFIPVAITELAVNPDQLIGIVTNNTGREVSGPIGVDAICFDAATPSVLSTPGGYLEQDALPEGATGSFSISMYGDACPRGLISASGYSF